MTGNFRLGLKEMNPDCSKAGRQQAPASPHHGFAEIAKGRNQTDGQYGLSRTPAKGSNDYSGKFHFIGLF